MPDLKIVDEYVKKLTITRDDAQMTIEAEGFAKIVLYNMTTYPLLSIMVQLMRQDAATKARKKALEVDKA